MFEFGIGIFYNWADPEIYVLALALSFLVLSLTLAPVLLAAIVLGLQKGKARRVRDDSTFVPVQNIDYYRDSLYELNPSLVTLLIDLDIYGKKDIIATLLRMQNKKVLSFIDNGEMILTGKNTQQLDRDEAELLAIIEAGRLNDKKSLLRWRQNRFLEAEKLGYIQRKAVMKEEIDGKSVVLGIVSFVSALFLWGAFLSLSLFEVRTVLELVRAFAALLAVDVLLFLPFYFLCRRAGYRKRGDVLWERTPLGNETAEKIAGLDRFIHEFSRLSEATKEQVVLWDDYLVYAIVLEENEKIVKDISRLYDIDLRSFTKVRLRRA